MSGSSREPVIRVESVRKVYPLQPTLGDALRGLVFGRLSGRGKEALAGVDLEVEAGTTLGVVGRNGSGKTTLLRILAGVLQPTEGRVRTRGRIAGLLELAAGIDPKFSGAENAVLLGLMAGATRREMRSRLDAIRAFSGLGEAFDQPVRSYSSGMSLRLAFSTAVHSEPEILLIDEVLAVGDAFFQQSCLLRIRQLQAAGCTIVLVTHDPSAVLGFCSRALWLEHGRVVCSGDPAKVVREYLAARYERGDTLDSGRLDGDAAPQAHSDDPVPPAETIPKIDNRYGDGAARLEGIALRDEAGRPLAVPLAGRPLRVVISARAVSDLHSPVIGFALRNRLGEIITATNSSYEGHPLAPLSAGSCITVEFVLQWPSFVSGMFSFSPSVADGSLDQHVMNDWIDNALVVEVSNPDALYGWLRLEGVEVRSSVSSEDPVSGIETGVES